MPLTGLDMNTGARDIRRMIKAAITTALFSTAGGKVPFKIVDKFVQLFREQTKLKGMVDFFSFEGDEANLDTFDMPYRVVYPQTESSDNRLRRSPVLNRVSLAPVRFNAKATITDESIDTNIEGKDFIDIVIATLAKAMSRDFEKLIIHGDELGPLTNEDRDVTGWAADKVIVDPMYDKVDGLITLALAQGNTLDVSGYTTKSFNAEIARQLVLSIPENRKPLKSEMSFFCSTQAYSDYWDTAYDVGTDTAAVKGNIPKFGLGFQNMIIEEIPLWENNPRRVKINSFTTNSSVTLDYPPVETDSDTLALASIGETYTTPYTRGGVDYSINLTTGVVTHVNTGSIPTGTNINITYRGGDNVVLMRPKNFAFGVKKDNMRIETDRFIDDAFDLYVIRMSVDDLFRDGTEVQIATGIVNKTAGA